MKTNAAPDTVTSTFVPGRSTAERRAGLYACALADIARLEAGIAEGWDLAADLERARAQAKAFAPAA
jgi:hypothetical protein